MVRMVRQQVAARDGYCRLATARAQMVAPCGGPSEWAHFADWRRSRTRGQAATARHCIQGTLMLCRSHHRAYDAHVLDLVALEPARGAVGRLAVVNVVSGETIYEESA